MDWTIALVLGLLVAFIGGYRVYSAVTKDRSKKQRVSMSKMGVLIIAVGLTVLLFGSSVYAPLGNPISEIGSIFTGDTLAVGGGAGAGAGAGSGSGSDSGSGTLCPVEDTTVTFSAINVFNQTSTAGTHRYKVNSGAPLTVSDAGTATLSPGDTLEILWENAATGSSYYSDIDTFPVPCSGTFRPVGELYPNGTLTLDVFNEEGDLISADTVDGSGSGGAINETLANGDVVTLEAKLKGTFQRGHPYGGVIVAEYDQTFFDDVQIDLGGSKTDTPTVYGTTNAGNTTKTYSFPAIIGSTSSTGGIIDGQIVIDADDDNNPGSEDEIQLTIYTNNYFINEDTGGSFDGPAVEDEDDARTYTHTTLTYLNVD